MLYKVLDLWNNMEQYGTIPCREFPGKSSPYALNYHHFSPGSARALTIREPSSISSPEILPRNIKLSSFFRGEKKPRDQPGAKGKWFLLFAGFFLRGKCTEYE